MLKSNIKGKGIKNFPEEDRSCWHRKTYTHQKVNSEVPVVAQWLRNPTRNHEVKGSIPGLDQWVKDLVLL